MDVGSNALRLIVGEVDSDRRLDVVESVREPVRLGQDVFTKGAIAEETMERAIKAFVKFRKLMEKHEVTRSRNVATSATREAFNRDIFIDRVAQESGINLAVISAEEESRLIHLAVAEKINLKNKLAMLIDIGGGSVEITLAEGDTIQCTESYKMGTVRLLHILEEKKRGARVFNQMVREYVDATHQRIKKEIGDRKIDLCIATGGNVESLGDLRKELFDKNSNAKVTADELDRLVKQLQGLTFEERIERLGLRSDRADVIIPASIVLQKIVEQAGVDEVLIPNVGLKDGLLLDMIQDDQTSLHHDQVIASAMQMGRKYAFDEQHAVTVAKWAMHLFDETRSLHNLGSEYRMLVEVAALLHDIGTFVNISDHHKHTYYLLMAAPLVGLSESQMAIVANVARYHRKSPPKPEHEPYRVLSSKERVVVSKLAAILRLADALDHEHAGKVSGLSVEYKKPDLVLTLRGKDELLLEKWALSKKATMFEEVFNLKVSVEE
jgi:exopolyphosphatase/guanosine-5'-triphosphate,3'-diphosphate pyrophosphatase